MKLRPLRRTDLSSLAAWLPGVAAEAGCGRWSQPDALPAAIGEAGVLVVDEGSGAVGLVVFQSDAPDRRSARIDLLAVEPEKRRLGSGGRAALALEKRLRRSMTRLYALVPSHIGLALYFWLRLGYQPLTRGERPAPAAARPAVWMVRDLR